MNAIALSPVSPVLVCDQIEGQNVFCLASTTPPPDGHQLIDAMHWADYSTVDYIVRIADLPIFPAFWNHVTGQLQEAWGPVSWNPPQGKNPSCYFLSPPSLQSCKRGPTSPCKNTDRRAGDLIL